MNAGPVERGAFPVFVPEAHTLGAIAVIRSLGRAGYPVIAASSSADGLGLVSNFTKTAVVSPGYDQQGYLSWLDQVLAVHEVRAIIPSEGFLLAIEEDYRKYSNLIPFSQDPKKVFEGLSKFDFFSNTPGENLPPHLFFDERGSAADDMARLQALPAPLFIKVDGSHSRTGKYGNVYPVENAAAAASKIAELRKDFRKLLVQGYAPGKGAGAFFVVWNGEILAEFMHLRLHEVPHTGGVSSLRRSFKHPKMLEDARKRILQFGWQGPAMLEYRWNEETDRFALMEMNGRFWGSLHLPLYAGIDFPKILLDAFRGEAGPPAIEYPEGLRCRVIFPLDLQHAWSVFKDPAFSAYSKFKAILNFFVLTLDPRIYSDLFSFPGDRGLFFIGFWRYLRELGAHFRRLKRRRKTSLSD